MQPLPDDIALHVPTSDDVGRVHELYSDPDVWRHAPHGRHVAVVTTRRMVERWVSDWENHGLGSWLVEDAVTGELLGNAGCSLRNGAHWNLGYRFAPAAQGRGIATRVARLALAAAWEKDPGIPRVASILEHNGASVAVAVRAGLTLQFRGLDVGNPDPSAVRLLYADRPLDPAKVRLILGH
ncbi:GNAT family N-acetyltransferase [Arthrobacter sp. RAF14]|uniref:GNAT family N-acetyltransferase n=1 Tax=Arthrobacter sp. RAF14 TaxID=3233051 RepID=UPI003F8FD393